MTMHRAKQSSSKKRTIALASILVLIGAYRLYQIQTVPKETMPGMPGSLLPPARVESGASAQAPFHFLTVKRPMPGSSTMDGVIFSVEVDKQPKRYPDLWPENMSTGGTEPDQLANTYFHATAQAMTGDGKEIGAPTDVNMTKDGYGKQELQMMIPAAYSRDTEKLRVSVEEADGERRKAQWVLTALPKSIQNFTDPHASPTHVKIGAVTVDAEAVERPDIERRLAPDFDDRHVITGLPAITCAISASSDTVPPSEEWDVDVLKITPQWSAPIVASDSQVNIQSPMETANPLITTLDFPYSHSVMFYYYCGPGFADQQKYVRIDAAVRRRRYRRETLTFQGGIVQTNPRTGSDSIYWRSPQTLTTPSGVTIVALNPRPRRAGSAVATATTAQPGPSSADLYVAWKMPDNYASRDQGGFDLHSLVERPQPLPPFKAKEEMFYTPPVWNEVSLPSDDLQKPNQSGGVEEAIAALRKQGYTLMRIPVQNISTTQSGSPSGAIEKITLEMQIRGELERFPIQWDVPVRKSFSARMSPQPAERRE